MVAAELESCHVPKDPTFPTHAEGCVVSFMAFYERGFSMPLHQFFRSLLWCYGHELHHLTPRGVLHIAAFVTPSEAYVGIDSDLYMWKYFFRVRHPQDPKAELTISRGAIIHIKSGHGGPYWIYTLW
jgi:hypothetical protein